MQRKVVCKNVVVQLWLSTTFDLWCNVSDCSQTDTSKNIWFIPLKSSFDVDTFAYRIFQFLTKGRYSVVLFRLVDGSKDFKLSCNTEHQL